MAADKIVKAANAANRNGDEIASATLLLVASIYLLGRDDYMKYVWVHAQSAAEQADEEKHRRRGVIPAGQDKVDQVDEALAAAARLAFFEGEMALSSIVSFLRSLRTVERADLLQQLKDVAESLAHKGAGRKPPKEITIFEDADGGEAS